MIHNQTSARTHRRRLLPEAQLALQLDVLRAWHQQAQVLGRLRRLGRRCELVHLRYLTLAWRAEASRMAHKRALQERAERHRRLELQGRALGALAVRAEWAHGVEESLRLRCARLRTRLVFQVGSWCYLEGAGTDLHPPS